MSSFKVETNADTWLYNILAELTAHIKGKPAKTLDKSEIHEEIILLCNTH